MITLLSYIIEYINRLKYLNKTMKLNYSKTNK